MKSIIIASLSAFILQLLNLVELQRVPPERHPDFKSLIYWLPFLINPIAGGFLAYLHISSGADLTPWISMNVGVSAPLILKSAATVIPTPPPE
jgi:hypothetical protein